MFINETNKNLNICISVICINIEKNKKKDKI